MKTRCGIAVVGLVLLLMAVSGTGASGKVDGNWLLRDCSESIWLSEGKTLAPDSPMGAAFCLGYVTGMLEMHVGYTGVNRMPPLFCQPDGIESSQAIRIIARYLQTHPERLHWAGAPLVTQAMRDAFPCPSAVAPPPQQMPSVVPRPSAPKAGKGKQW
jgi:hypothetical protein